MKSSATIVLGGSQYQKIIYPAGETQVRFADRHGKELSKCSEINVIARIHNAQDIIELLILESALQEVNDTVNILVPYLPYGRADRRFTKYDCYGLRTFDSLFDGVSGSLYTIDAHSDRAYNFCDLSPIRLIQQAVRRFAWRVEGGLTILFPDKGAKDRYSSMISDLSGNLEIVRPEIAYCTKKRDAKTGKLLDFKVPKIKTSHVLIVDDICDGGGTFIGIREKIPKNTHVGLYVTHGIFSQGVSRLTDVFDVVYTTDSFKDHENSSLVVFPAISEMLRQIYEGEEN